MKVEKRQEDYWYSMGNTTTLSSHLLESNQPYSLAAISHFMAILSPSAFIPHTHANSRKTPFVLAEPSGTSLFPLQSISSSKARTKCDIHKNRVIGRNFGPCSTALLDGEFGPGRCLFHQSGGERNN